MSGRDGNLSVFIADDFSHSYEIRTEDGERVAVVFPEDYSDAAIEEARRDAWLFAAAPEMMEALRKVLATAEKLESAADGKCIACGGNSTRGHRVACPVAELWAAEDAIEKAIAGSPALGGMSFDPKATGGAR